MIIQWSPASGQNYFYPGTWARLWLATSWIGTRGARLCGRIDIFARLEATVDMSGKILRGVCR
jgi:hypothetical protein